jgi:antitoxin YefM
MESVSYTEARERLAELWDSVTHDRNAVRLTRRGADPVVLIAADEYDGLLETAQLLRSPANAARLLNALRRAEAGEGIPVSLDELRSDFERAEEV